MNVLFLGLGSAGQRHLKNLKLILGDELIPSTVSTKKFKPAISEDLKNITQSNVYEKYGLKIFCSSKEAFRNNPDLTIISTPSIFHFANCKEALEAKSHVFIEKPVVLKASEINILEEIAKKNKIKISVSFQMRFTPWIKFIKNLVQSNVYGNPVYISSIISEYLPDWHPYEDYRVSYAAKKKLGGGVVITQIHELDYLYYILGNLNFHSGICEKNSLLEIDVEDIGISILTSKYKDKIIPISLIQSYVGNPKKRELIIQFSNAKLLCDLSSGKVIIHENNNIIIKEFEFERNQSFLEQMRIFINSLKNDIKDAPVTLKEAKVSLEIAEKIRKI